MEDFTEEVYFLYDNATAFAIRISDEVGAIVFDAGSHSFRAGYGGEEYPKVSKY